VVQYNETMGLFARSVGPVAAAALACACSPFGGGEFACAQDDQCSGGPSGGRCEADGRCSFPDSTCASGRKYGGFAGDKSNTCVGGTVDAPLVDSPIDTPMATPFCDPTDTTLTGCWQFEGNGTDGSGAANPADTSTGLFAIGKVGQGLTLTTTSVITVGDRPSLDSPNLTVEGWIRPTVSQTARMGVLDHDGAYGLFFTDRTVTCTHSGVVAAFTFPLNAWSHVACTYDGTTGSLYINGVLAMSAATTPIGVSNANGLVLGGNSPNGDALVGTIDQIRIWNVARTAAQICTAAGLSTCP
jgi:hypothetical protein